MSETRDRQIAELEAQLLALRSKPAAPEPAEVPAEVNRNPEPESVQVSGLKLLAGDTEPEPVTVPELPAFMRQYPEPTRGPHLMKSASNETPVLHP
jgi:hypothetical protein